MSFPANVLCIMVASPSDVADERKTAVEIIHEWNAAHTLSRQTVLLPLLHETTARPAMGDGPQTIVNRQLLQHADVVIGIFWTRLGTPTTEHESGTVEEIRRQVNAGGEVWLYFSDTPVSPRGVNPAQYEALLRFREECEGRAYVQRYAGLDEFRTLLRRHLATYLAGRADDLVVSAGDPVLDKTPSVAAVELSEDARHLLTEASADAQGEVRWMGFDGGCQLLTNGKEFIGRDWAPRSIARWRAALNELLGHGLLVMDPNKPRGLYDVSDAGFRVVDGGSAQVAPPSK